MAKFSIRKYNNSDYDAVRLLFAEGMFGLVPASAFYFLKHPQVNIFFLVFFIILLFISKSFLLSLVGLAAMLAVCWHLLKSEFNQYVEKSKREDLRDIEKSYMEMERSCFWVVESNGKVVGMVGVQTAQDSNEEMVLRRMSVAKDHRGQGIAKALCLKAIDFARQHRCRVMSLETSIIQFAAQKLYEHLGFKKVSAVTLPSLFGRLTNFCILCYEYNIKP
ncbi:probable N-acetyltransferase camello [Bombina bombina]|uniref:probable N-acetyltransferase camello n=1 Tax=Bombina bombina TaxID=8345 RepID=UPI00235B271E|nr:probable N-acetyltransferase camello [Bombina bombina]XP_053560348.1 probable N-acetyltransferase camello [Bombina bombina]XP_053560349.1 probable N-acetyltransferase camello [Bombina bombina]XP_053560350.1 probable N-acetyltransferase camello [Bombina bombina]